MKLRVRTLMFATLATIVAISASFAVFGLDPAAVTPQSAQAGEAGQEHLFEVVYSYRPSSSPHRLSTDAMGPNFLVIESAHSDETPAHAELRLSMQPGTLVVTPHQTFSASVISDPEWINQWGLQSAANQGISVETAWTKTKGSSTVIVAILDTGITAHPDLTGAVPTGAGYDFISSTASSVDGNGWDSNPTDPGDYRDAARATACAKTVTNSSWHGTHVAGIVAARENSIGVVGIAPQVSILPVRVLGACDGNSTDIANGIRWAAGVTTDISGALFPVQNSRPAKVINLSLGGRGACSTTMQSAVTAARSQGAVIIASAGNDYGLDVSGTTPANCTGVLSVVALGQDGGRASYSNYGQTASVAAPGSSILSTKLGSLYGNLGDYTYVRDSGTSMAAPMVSGVAALMLSLNSSMTRSQLETYLQATAGAFTTVSSGYQCVPTGSTQTTLQKVCGSGRLDASAAVKLLQASLTVTTSQTAFTYGAVSEFSASVTGGSGSGATSLTTVTPSVCTLGGTVVTVLTAGNCQLRGTKRADADYLSATTDVVVTISKATQEPLVLTPSVTEISYQASPLATTSIQVTGGSGTGAITAFSSTTAVCTVSDLTVTIKSPGTCTLYAQRAADVNYALQTSATTQITVSKATQTITYVGPTSKTFGDGVFTIATTASSGLTVVRSSLTTAVCTILNNSVTILHAGTCSLSLTQAGNSNFLAASSTITITVAKASQTLSAVSPTGLTFTSPVQSLSASATSGLLVSATSTSPAVCTVTSLQLTVVDVGECNITFSQSGSSDWLSAADVSVSTQIARASQVVSFGRPASALVGDGGVVIPATASSSLTVVSSSLTTDICTISGGALTHIAAGVCTVRLTQEGSTQFLATTRTVSWPVLGHWTDISSGAQTTCGIRDTQLYCWGRNSAGQLGIGNLIDTYTPTRVGTASWKMVSVGSAHVCGIQTDGSLWCWGSNFNYKIGDGTNINRSSPVRITSDLWSTVSAGDTHSCGITSAGVLACWGANTYGQLGNNSQTGNGAPSGWITGFVSVSAGSEFTCGVKNDDTGWCWGRNTNGQLADGTKSSAKNPKQIVGILFDEIATGWSHACGRVVTGLESGYSLYCWGENTYARVADNTCMDCLSPVLVSSSNLGVVAPGGTFSCFSSGLDLGSCWGDGSAYQLGNATALSRIPVNVGKPSDLMDGGWDHVCAIDSSARLSCWGSNAFGQLGIGTTSTRELPARVLATNQAIDFQSVSPLEYSAEVPPIDLTATTTSGLQVQFSTDTPLVCAVSGTSLQILGAGTCVVVAYQPGDRTWNEVRVTQSITIAKATQTITFTQPDATTYGAGPITLSASSSAGLTVSFTSGTTSVCTVSGSSVTILAAGTCTITASQAGSSNYSAATSVPRSITINKASQAALTAVPSTSSATYRATPATTLTLSATGGSGSGAVTYTSDTLSVCTVSGSTVTILSAGICTVSAAKASDTNYLGATSDPVSITVAKAAQTITVTTPTTKTYGGAPFTISATSSAGLTVTFTSTTTESCTVTGSSVTILSAGTCTITASQAGTSNYESVTAAPVSFTISKASQAALTVVPETTSSTYDPTTPVTIVLSASGGSGDGMLTYAASTPTICTVTESTVTILAAGTCTVSVSKATDANYLGATSAGVSILVTTASFPSLTVNPTLAGTPAIGSKLTATAGQWASATNSTLQLQWVRCSTNAAEYAVHSSNQLMSTGCSVIGTTNATSYTLVDADLNKYIQIKVMASNASGASSVFTPTTLAVGRPPAVSGTKYPVVTGTPKLGSALTGTLGTWLGTPTPTLQRGWVRCTSASASVSSALPSGCTVIPDGLGATLTLTTDDVGRYLRSFVTASSYAGTKTWYSATTAQIDRVPTALVAPSISGTVKVGVVLTAARGTWAGSPSVTYKYQWYRCTGSSIAAGPYGSSTQKPANCTLISGATGSTYMAVALDKGKYLSVRITATNRAGTIYLFSNPTAKVQ